jgi:hypothetical protein
MLFLNPGLNDSAPTIPLNPMDIAGLEVSVLIDPFQAVAQSWTSTNIPNKGVKILHQTSAASRGSAPQMLAIH